MFWIVLALFASGADEGEVVIERQGLLQVAVSFATYLKTIRNHEWTDTLAHWQTAQGKAMLGTLLSQVSSIVSARGVCMAWGRILLLSPARDTSTHVKPTSTHATVLASAV